MSDCTPTRQSIRAVYVGAFDIDPNDEGKDAAEAFHGESFDRFIAKVKADAWDEGLQAGWEECQNPGPFVNDWWDSKSPNPYRAEGEA